ncbi:MAG: putative membrane protein [Paraglaciecola sp.]|jgi:uncharacterized membrane protein
MVILGSGVACCFVTNVFVTTWPAERIEVTLVESPDIGFG